METVKICRLYEGDCGGQVMCEIPHPITKFKLVYVDSMDPNSIVYAYGFDCSIVIRVFSENEFCASIYEHGLHKVIESVGKASPETFVKEIVHTLAANVGKEVCFITARNITSVGNFILPLIYSGCGTYDKTVIACFNGENERVQKALLLDTLNLLDVTEADVDEILRMQEGAVCQHTVYVNKETAHLTTPDFRNYGEVYVCKQFGNLSLVCIYDKKIRCEAIRYPDLLYWAPTEDLIFMLADFETICNYCSEMATKDWVVRKSLTQHLTNFRLPVCHGTE